MSAIIDQIQNNTLVELRMSETDEYLIDNVKAIIDALHKNTSITTVDCHRGYLGCLRCDSRSALIQTVGKLPNLQEVSMNLSMVHVADLSKMILNAPSLRVLKLNHLLLQGVEDEFIVCEAAMYYHKRLADFEMNECSPAKCGISIKGLEIAGKKEVASSGRLASPKPVLKNARVA